MKELAMPTTYYSRQRCCCLLALCWQIAWGYITGWGPCSTFPLPFVSCLVLLWPLTDSCTGRPWLANGGKGVYKAIISFIPLTEFMLLYYSSRDFSLRSSSSSSSYLHRVTFLLDGEGRKMMMAIVVRITLAPSSASLCWLLVSIVITLLETSWFLFAYSI